MPLRLENPAEAWGHEHCGESSCRDGRAVEAGGDRRPERRGDTYPPALLVPVSVAVVRAFGLSGAVALPRLDLAAAANPIAASTITDASSPSTNPPHEATSVERPIRSVPRARGRPRLLEEGWAGNRRRHRHGPRLVHRVAGERADRHGGGHSDGKSIRYRGCAPEEATSNVSRIAATCEEFNSSAQEIDRQVSGSTRLARTASPEANRTPDLG